MPKSFYEILWIGEDEMHEIMAGRAGEIDGRPVYFCKTRDGLLRTWPHFNPEKMLLFFSYKGET